VRTPCNDKNPEDKFGFTPLHSAAVHGNLEVVKLLMDHAKVKNPGDKTGKTPLHYAAKNGNREIVKWIQNYTNCSLDGGED
jgi:ankyrin repeat protein